MQKHPRFINVVKINILKNEFSKALRLQVDNQSDVTGSMSYSYDGTTQHLHSFTASSRTSLARASSLLLSGDIMEQYNSRVSDISQFYFKSEERSELARLLIRKYDINFIHHCPKKNCGSQCEFTIENCPNENCICQYSHKWAVEHDSICAEKIVPCERTCGECFARRLMTQHISRECSLR